MGEDEAGRLLEGQQPLLIFQNQVVGRNIVGELAAFLCGAVDAAPRLFVDAEITTMDFGYIIPGGFQVSLVGRVEQLNVVVGNINILLLKHFAVFTQNFLAVLVILAIFGNLVNEEQGEGLNTSGKQLFFLLKVGNDGLSNLDTAHILLRHITHHIPLEDGNAIGKGHSGPQRVNLGDNIALVLLHFLGGGIQAVANAQDTRFTVGGLVIADFHFNLCHGRLVLGQDNLFQEHIMVSASEVLNLKALDLNPLYQTLVVGFQSIQHIHKIMLLLMGSGVIDGEQRIEVFQSLLGHFTAHFLRFIQNDDGIVGCNHINGAAGTKLVTFGVDDSGCCVTLAALHIFVLVHRGCECLGIDNHDVNPSGGRKGVQLVQVGTVVNKETGFLLVVLHEVFRCILEGLVNALTNSNAGNHHNELAPAILLVQLEHGLDIDVGFARACFHLHIQIDPAQLPDKGSILTNVVLLLKPLDILEKLGI